MVIQVTGLEDTAKQLKVSVDHPELLSVLPVPPIDANHQVSVTVQAGKTAGLATLSIGDPGSSKLKTLPIRLVAPPLPSDTQRIFAALSSFLLIMLLTSIGAEKTTDLVKMWLTRKGTLQAPKPTFKEALGADYKWLAVLSPTQIDTVWAVMCVPAQVPPAPTTPPTAPSLNHVVEIVEQDFKRQRAAARWAWQWRLVALVFGTGFAVALNLDTVALLSPLMGSAVDATTPAAAARGLAHTGGYLLTGFGASAGASFWQDFLDKLTQWKKAAAVQA
jgi:hypothetical protein